MSKEPTRLMEGGGGPLGEEIAALRGRLPSSERMAALAERLAAAGATVEAAPLADPPRVVTLEGQRPRKALDPSFKLVTMALIAGGALIGAALWSRRSDAPSPSPSVPAPAALTSVASATPGPSAPVTAARENAVLTPNPPSAAASIAPLAPVKPVESTKATGTFESPSSTVGPLPTVSAAAGLARQPATDPTRSERELGRTATNKVTKHDENPIAGGPLAENTVTVSEVELLKQARSALGGDPAQAFALTERCRAQYPSGGFAQEREFIAISALYRMHRGEDARSRFSLFKMHYPSSAYLPALTRLLGTE